MTVDPNQRPYSINELTVLHNLSRRTVIRLYENDPGVQILQASRDHQQALGRRHRTIRVPRYVYTLGQAQAGTETQSARR
ncbi:MAG TPA: hypothetical protein VNO32_02650 [Candidatus Acidoferrum sp.]|nr:hypothetical protein [Candidatus Acidoferrum sp.]